jgi:hypothetical protein
VADLPLQALSGTRNAREAYQPIKALADGLFFSTIGRDQHGGYVMRRDASGVQVQQLSSAVVVYATRVDGNGQYNMITLSGKTQTQCVGRYWVDVPLELGPPHFDLQVSSSAFEYDAKFYLNQLGLSDKHPIPSE